jgi:hypothetical protein
MDRRRAKQLQSGLASSLVSLVGPFCDSMFDARQDTPASGSGRDITSPVGVRADEGLVRQLISRGFSENGAIRAAVATGKGKSLTG